MASGRKRQDEKNLKVLRELGSLLHNKHCFDCNQRGPTYVNVTIGSFVCTKCSGILRGLTPPHRVKSISMATFTQDEMDLIHSKGNQYCRKVWLGLYDGGLSSDVRDEQTIRHFMTEKYEQKRYYLDPASSIHNTSQTVVNKLPETKPVILPTNKSLRVNLIDKSKKNDFIADFGSANIFNASNNNVQPSFANFDNNPVFSNVNTQPTVFNNANLFMPSKPVGPVAPPEDRYAALKDLDNAFKSQSPIDWNLGSNGSLYSSSTTNGSLYNSPSPQNSMYGSPSQTQFGCTFPQETSKVINPFNNNLNWNNSKSVNPFRVDDVNKMNGLQSNFHVDFTLNDTTRTINPFSVGTSGGRSNNPFL